jgi:PIN domain nuclease of toxin-antitoxin system
VTGKLLDTNIALFALGAPDRLSRAALAAIQSGPNMLSVVSFWEVVLKSAKGTLTVSDPQLWWRDALDRLAATPLLLRPEHVSAVCDLPQHHKDPFDRVLISQAITEGLTLVTSDAEFARYRSKHLRLVQ